jgi:HD-GYP domain-containing protein (c-di-GMP phosphodiesterase class II)
MIRETILSSLRADGIADVLQQWRTKAITIVLYAISIAALPTVLSGAILSRGRREMTVVMLLIYALVAITAVFKRCDYRLRGWVIITAGYAMAVNSFVPLGLASSGRSYLIVLPIIAFILIGIRAGWIATAASFLIYGSLILFAYTGSLAQWLEPLSDPLDMTLWSVTGLTTAMLLVTVVVLFLSMYRFLVDALEAERTASAELVQTYDATLEGWAHALELRDLETAGHCQRVSDVATRLAAEAGMADNGMRDVYRGSLLHDVGKMGVPDSILLKPGKLTDEEFRRMQAHTTYAYDLLMHIPFLLKALDIPYCHHERWDGNGYPRGLAGTDIPLSARVFSVVDVYDALTSDRRYRPAWPAEKAMNYIRERAGTEFDPSVVEAFLGMVSREASAPPATPGASA